MYPSSNRSPDKTCPSLQHDLPSAYRSIDSYLLTFQNTSLDALLFTSEKIYEEIQFGRTTTCHDTHTCASTHIHIHIFHFLFAFYGIVCILVLCFLVLCSDQILVALFLKSTLSRYDRYTKSCKYLMYITMCLEISTSVKPSSLSIP